MGQTKNIINGVFFVLVLVATIIIVIYHSYKILYKEGFETEKILGYDLNINTNKNYLNNIMKLLKQQYPNVDTTLNNYGLSNPAEDPNSPLKIDSTNLDAEYQVKFIQELQNREINDLESWMTLLKKRIPNENKIFDKNNVKSVKHIPTGKLFGILKNPNQIGPQISIIIDPTNATCIKNINAPTTENDIIKNIDLTACDYNPRAPGQKFILETVTNNQEFNNMLNANERSKYMVSDNYGFGVYPFSVIKTAIPNSDIFDTHVSLGECITLDNTGLSIEPCTGKESQRFTMTDIPVTVGLN